MLTNGPKNSPGRQTVTKRCGRQMVTKMVGAENGRSDKWSQKWSGQQMVTKRSGRQMVTKMIGRKMVGATNGHKNGRGDMCHHFHDRTVYVNLLMSNTTVCIVSCSVAHTTNVVLQVDTMPLHDICLLGNVIQTIACEGHWLCLREAVFVFVGP